MEAAAVGALRSVPYGILPIDLPIQQVGNQILDLLRRCFLMVGDRPMSDALLLDIAQYCRGAGIAESTFGRLAVNDGKLVNRLRLGGRVTIETAERVRA